jgi:hypothetical protein
MLRDLPLATLGTLATLATLTAVGTLATLAVLLPGAGGAELLDQGRVLRLELLLHGFETDHLLGGQAELRAVLENAGDRCATLLLPYLLLLSLGGPGRLRLECHRCGGDRRQQCPTKDPLHVVSPIRKCSQLRVVTRCSRHSLTNAYL